MSDPANTSSDAATSTAVVAAPVALIAAHGDLAAGLRSAVEQITGRGALLGTMTNRDMGAAEIEAAMREWLASTGARVVFTDLPAGSCALAARRVLRDDPELTIVTGTNLSTLLDFVCAAESGCGDGACGGVDVRSAEGARAAAARAVQRGQVALAPRPVTAGVTTAPGGAARAG